ncbi:MAG: glucose 1-dehydrogenase [Chloroflexi bacterium]|nr:glucose 1-dehydrogenase [Chloroflexota bacterium]
MLLEGKIAIITGGAAGIGKATAEKFAAEGATVIICDMAEDSGKQVAGSIGGRFDRIDVSDYAAMKAWVDGIVQEYERVDILVNNAGILRDGQLVKYKDGEVIGMMSEADFDAVINVNLKGVFNGTQAVVPYMIAQGGGVILSASSVVGLDGNFGQTNYVATKAGVVGMTKVWARELGRYGIRVNAVAPGFIETAMVAGMPERILEGMVNKTPLRRMGKPEDIANAYAWLASDQASFITGHTLRVDGGVVVGT